MTAMLVMMSGRNMPPPPAIPPVNITHGTNVPNPPENNEAINESEVGKRMIVKDDSNLKSNWK